MTEKKDIKIRLAKREDAFKVSALLSKLGLNVPIENEKINNHWDRLWDKNPYYSVFHEEILYGWIMEHDERIVGFFGCFPRIYCLDSKFISVAIASHWGVEKEFRAYTNSLCEKFFNENPISLKLVTTAIKPTGRIFEKFGGHKVPIPEMETVYMIPINLSKLIIHKYNNSSLKYIFTILSYFIPWKLQFSFIFKNHNIKEINIDSLPNDINAFFEHRIKKTSGLIACRNKEVLEWFYQEGNLTLSKKMFLYIKNNKTLGYASIIDEPIKDNLNLKRYKIIDLVAENSQIKKEIIRELVRYAYKMNIDVLEIHQPGMIEKKDIPVITMQRKSPQFPLFYQTTEKELNELLKSKNQWNIMPFDGDTCLG